MQNSFADVMEARQHGLSDGYTWWFDLPFKSLESPRPDMLGAGYVMVSAEDISHYLLAQLNDGAYQKTRVLSAESVALMHKRTTLSNGESEYGMGWVSYIENGLTHVNHNGASPGFTCTMFLIPEKKLGVAALTNVGTLLPPHAAGDRYRYLPLVAFEIASSEQEKQLRGSLVTLQLTNAAASVIVLLGECIKYKP